jgi:DNA-binding NarL/FixJ family response regulator
MARRAELGTRPGRSWSANDRRELGDGLLRSRQSAELLRFGTDHLGWSPGGRRAMAAWKIFLQSPAFDRACDVFDPAAGRSFVAHLIACAEPRFAPATPGPLWSWFDIALTTRRGYEDREIVAKMTHWVAGLTGSSGYTPETSEILWTDFWVRRAAQAVRTFDAKRDFFEYVTTWARDVEARILRLRARQWTQLERELVVLWMYDNALRKLLATAIRRGVPTQSAEDVVQSFWTAQGFDGLQGVLTNYVPDSTKNSAEQFLAFVRAAMKRAAGKFVTRSQPDVSREVQIDEVVASDEGYMPDQLRSKDDAVDRAVIDRERLGLIRSAIDRCKPHLLPRDSRILDLILRGETNRTIATDLGVAENAANVAIFRLNHRLVALLSNEAQNDAVLANYLREHTHYESRPV